MRCQYVLNEREVNQICGNGEVWEKYKKLILRLGLLNIKGCMGCPTPGCENWLVVDSDNNTRVNCYCDSCHSSFCSICREIYHYKSSCEEVVEIKKRWIQWNSQDRFHHEDDLINQALELRKKDLKERMEDLVKDEKWKEENLRLCPSCKRPIEKVSGCDAMICGQNYHGGDIQNGCGANFTWTDAPSYISSMVDTDHLKTILDDDLKIDPSDILRVKGDHGEYIQCDECQMRIIGFRFACIHCPCFELCEECERKTKHTPNHVFRIYTKPEIDLALIAAQEEEENKRLFEEYTRLIDESEKENNNNDVVDNGNDNEEIIVFGTPRPKKSKRITNWIKQRLRFL